MPDDREDLRQRIEELEATVRGLTQEIVEANERIRQLEEGAEAAPEPRPEPADSPMEEATEEVDEDPETAEEGEDDIIVA